MLCIQCIKVHALVVKFTMYIFVSLNDGVSMVQNFIDHFCIFGWLPALLKPILEIQVRSGWLWLPVFPMLIFVSWKLADIAKMVNNYH